METRVEFNLTEEAAKKLQADINSGEIERLFGNDINAYVFDNEAENDIEDGKSLSDTFKGLDDRRLHLKEQKPSSHSVKGSVCSLQEKSQEFDRVETEKRRGLLKKSEQNSLQSLTPFLMSSALAAVFAIGFFWIWNDREKKVAALELLSSEPSDPFDSSPLASDPFSPRQTYRGSLPVLSKISPELEELVVNELNKALGDLRSLRIDEDKLEETLSKKLREIDDKIEKRSSELSSVEYQLESKLSDKAVHEAEIATLLNQVEALKRNKESLIFTLNEINSKTFVEWLGYQFQLNELDSIEEVIDLLASTNGSAGHEFEWFFSNVFASWSYERKLEFLEEKFLTRKLLEGEINELRNSISTEFWKQNQTGREAILWLIANCSGISETEGYVFHQFKYKEFDISFRNRYVEDNDELSYVFDNIIKLHRYAPESELYKTTTAIFETGNDKRSEEFLAALESSLPKHESESLGGSIATNKRIERAVGFLKGLMPPKLLINQKLQDLVSDWKLYQVKNNEFAEAYIENDPEYYLLYFSVPPFDKNVEQIVYQDAVASFKECLVDNSRVEMIQVIDLANKNNLAASVDKIESQVKKLAVGNNIPWKMFFYKNDDERMDFVNLERGFQVKDELILLDARGNVILKGWDVFDTVKRLGEQKSLPE